MFQCPKCLKRYEQPQDHACRIVPKAGWIPMHTAYEARRTYVLKVLHFFEGNRTHTAKFLKISIRTLRNWLARYRRDGFEFTDHDETPRTGEATWV